MSAPRTDTLLQLLERTGHRIRCFDLGRRIAELTREQFLEFERTLATYPYPLNRQAWFALLFLPPPAAAREPFVWFLRLPLDEQGKLLQASRDDLLQRLLERLGEHLQHSEGDGQLQNALQENPYSFKPRDDRLALLHALLSRQLKQPPSRHYQPAQAYLAGETGWEQWSFVGYQGIADVAVRHDLDGNGRRLQNALAHLPARPLEALCHCLESIPLPADLASALADRCQRELAKEAPDSTDLAALARAIGASDPAWRNPLIDNLLASSQSHDPVLLGAIAARCWEALSAPGRAARFLDRLADNGDGQAVFDDCLADLLFVPGLREPLLQAVRDPGRSTALSTAIGHFFQRLRQGGR